MSTDGSAASRTTLPASLAIMAVIVGWIAMQAMAEASAPAGLRTMLIVAEVCLVAPALIAMLVFRVPLRAGLALYPTGTRPTTLALIMGAALWATALGVLNLQGAAWPPPPGYLESFQALHNALRPQGLLEAVASVTAVALVPALCEESLFRGIVQPALLRVTRPLAAIVVSGILFGLIHVAPTPDAALMFYQVPFTAILGIGLGLLRDRAGSLLPSLLAHAFINTTTFLAVLASDLSVTPEPPNAIEGAGLLAAGVAVSALLLRRFPTRPPDAA